MSFQLTEQALIRLFDCANFELAGDPLVFVGLRGCVPVTPFNSGFAQAHDLQMLSVDYTHMRCTIIQWRPGNGFAVYPGSTVPHRSAVQAHIPHGGYGANELAVGYYHGGHRFVRGDHSLANPRLRHRAFRNDSPLPVRRTADDDDYDGLDALTFGVANDNIHCARQQDPGAPIFSSNGCQVVAGRPRIPAMGWEIELGPWAKFVEVGYSSDQSRFCYALFNSSEALAAVISDQGARSKTVRFGSERDLVRRTQEALIKQGFDIGDAGADGDFGWRTLSAVREVQLNSFGPNGVDLVVGPTTAAALGITDWPRENDFSNFGPASLSAYGRAIEKGPTFRSLSGRFYSANPFDLSVKRSVRTNNPGALNISNWQKRFPGFANVTQPDNLGNVTTIYWTPEHGIAAWHYLMTDRYGWGSSGQFSLEKLARKYAGIDDPDHKAVKSYLAGWRRRSGDVLSNQSLLSLNIDDEMIVLGKAMFGHECAGTSPIEPEQIVMALDLKRRGALPPF